MDRYSPVYGQQRFLDQLLGGQAGADGNNRFMRIMQMLNGNNAGGPSIGPPTQNPATDPLNGPYGRGWSALQQMMAMSNAAEMLSGTGVDVPPWLASEGASDGGAGGGGAAGGGGGGGGGGGWAYGAANLDPRFGYGPDEGANDPRSRDPFSNGMFQLPASFVSTLPAGTDPYQAYFDQVYGPELAKNPYTKIPSWAWKYAIDAEGRGYPPGSYGQLSDGSWVTPDGLDPHGIDTGQYSMDAFGKNPPGQETGPGSPGADFDHSRHPSLVGGIPDGKAPAQGPAFGSVNQQFTPSGAGGGPSRRREGARGGNRGGVWSGPARRPNHPNGGFQANGATAFGGGGRNVPAGGGNSFPGGGYAMPGQIDRGIREGRPDRIRNEPDWGGHNARRTGGGDDVVRVSDNGRRTRYADGTVVREGKERDRVRTRSNENGTSTNITISRDGGRVVSNQSGGDGNRGRNAGNGGSANASADRQRVVEQAQRAAQQANRSNERRNDAKRDDRKKR